jgi:hypothetical protein
LNAVLQTNCLLNDQFLVLKMNPLSPLYELRMENSS